MRNFDATIPAILFLCFDGCGPPPFPNPLPPPFSPCVGLPLPSLPPEPGTSSSSISPSSSSTLVVPSPGIAKSSSLGLRTLISFFFISLTSSLRFSALSSGEFSSRSSVRYSPTEGSNSSSLLSFLSSSMQDL